MKNIVFRSMEIIHGYKIEGHPIFVSAIELNHIRFIEIKGFGTSVPR